MLAFPLCGDRGTPCLACLVAIYRDPLPFQGCIALICALLPVALLSRIQAGSLCRKSTYCDRGCPRLKISDDGLSQQPERFTISRFGQFNVQVSPGYKDVSALVMSSPKTRVLRSTFDTVSHSGVHHVFNLKQNAFGVIFILHHARPEAGTCGFTPNGIPDISPEFLKIAVQRIIEYGYEIISLDEFMLRMADKEVRLFHASMMLAWTAACTRFLFSAHMVPRLRYTRRQTSVMERGCTGFLKNTSV